MPPILSNAFGIALYGMFIAIILPPCKSDFKTMIVLAIATSIDALAVGVTFAFLKVNLFIAFSWICFA